MGGGWRGRRRREAKPPGFGRANGGDRANRARRDARAHVFAREKQKGTPQLPLISVPRSGFRAFRGRKQTRTGLSADRISGFQKIGISLEKLRLGFVLLRSYFVFFIRTYFDFLSNAT